MRDCIKIELKENAHLIYDEVEEKGVRLYSRLDYTDEGANEIAIVWYGEKLFELEYNRGIKIVRLILVQ